MGLYPLKAHRLSILISCWGRGGLVSIGPGLAPPSLEPEDARNIKDPDEHVVSIDQTIQCSH